MTETFTLDRPVKEICLECRKDTSWGSGNHVNRIPCGREEEDGWLCAECQLITCDNCHGEVLDYECSMKGDLLCTDCYEEIGSDIVVMFIDEIIEKYADYFGFKKGTVKPEYNGDFLELLELLRGVTYVESRGNGWAIEQGFEKNRSE